MHVRVTVGVAAMLLAGSVSVGSPRSAPSVATSEPAPSSEPPSSPPTTEVTTTTVDPVVAVSEAAVAARAARLAALSAPDDDAAIDALDSWYTAEGAARAELDAELQALRDGGLMMQANPNTPDSLVVETALIVDDTHADVTACVVDSAITVAETTDTTVDSAPSESIVDDDVRAFRATYAMVAEEGVWKVDTITVAEEWPGETICPPPPTTTASPTTLEPIVTEEALIAQRVLEIHTVRWNAYVTPDAPGTTESLDANYTEGGVARQVVDSDLQSLLDEGWLVRDNPDVPQSLTVEEVTLLDGPPASRADAVVCMIDSGVVYEPGGLPDGGDAIVSGEFVAVRSLQHLVLEDNVWQLSEVETIDEWTGETQCPSAT